MYIVLFLYDTICYYVIHYFIKVRFAGSLERALPRRHFWAFYKSCYNVDINKAAKLI